MEVLRKDPLPALAANYLIWGNIERFVNVITEHPYVLCIHTQATDHIDTTSGTLLQIALQIGEVVLKDANGKTVVEVIEGLLEFYFGKKELQKQKDPMCSFLLKRAEEYRIKQDEDKKALEVFCDVLDSSDVHAKALVEIPNFMKAYHAFETQLKKPSDWAILMLGEQNSCHKNLHKNIFYEDQILGKIQRYRMRAWELQVLFSGVDFYDDGYNVDGNVFLPVPRIDIRFHAGLSPGSEWELGVHFSIDSSGADSVHRREAELKCVVTLLRNPLSSLEKFFEQKSACFKTYINAQRQPRNVCSNSL